METLVEHRNSQREIYTLNGLVSHIRININISIAKNMLEPGLHKHKHKPKPKHKLKEWNFSITFYLWLCLCCEYLSVNRAYISISVSKRLVLTSA